MSHRSRKRVQWLVAVIVLLRVVCWQASSRTRQIDNSQQPTDCRWWQRREISPVRLPNVSLGGSLTHTGVGGRKKRTGRRIGAQVAACVSVCKRWEVHTHTVAKNSSPRKLIVFVVQQTNYAFQTALCIVMLLLLLLLLNHLVVAAHLAKKSPRSSQQQQQWPFNEWAGARTLVCGNSNSNR